MIGIFSIIYAHSAFDCRFDKTNEHSANYRADVISRRRERDEMRCVAKRKVGNAKWTLIRSVLDLNLLLCLEQASKRALFNKIHINTIRLHGNLF